MPVILHLDLDAFFCAVEEIYDPSLRAKPFAVGGQPDERGVVASCSYPARAHGVRSAMPMSQALRICPSLRIVPPNHARYSEHSRQVMGRLHEKSPLVEQISVDEAFLNIGDIRQPARTFAEQLQTQIWEETRLPCSIGIASNKLVAKIATETGKAAARGTDYPRAITVIETGHEAEFLAPLPVSTLWGVGKKTAARLQSLGVHTIGDLARYPERELTALFGKPGRDLLQHAHGIDNRPVTPEHETKSISQETTFPRDLRDDKALEASLKKLSAEVGHNLRRENLAAKTVKIKLRWPDFTTLTRQTTLPAPTDQTADIETIALALLKQTRSPGQPVRLLGVGVSNLGPAIHQMELWGQAGEKQRKLQSALDALQEKFGKNIIAKGKT
jgi:DNA polymerase IV